MFMTNSSSDDMLKTNLGIHVYPKSVLSITRSSVGTTLRLCNRHVVIRMRDD